MSLKISYGKRTTLSCLVLKLAVLLMPFFIFIPITMNYFSMWFLDEEYGWYQQNKDFSEDSLKHMGVLIMGDSTAKAAWLPEELSDDSYNFALGGAGLIEEFYCLQEYLQRHEAPRSIVYMQTINNFCVLGNFWTRCIYFHRLNENSLRDLVKEVRSFGDNSIFREGEMEHELFLYQSYSPVKYGMAFFKGLLSLGRYGFNKSRYTSAEISRGHVWFGTSECYDTLNAYTDWDSFQADPFLDYYFRKLIELCEANDIQFIFQNAPMNESSFEALQEPFVEDYTAYLESIQEAYPDAVIDTKLFAYENNCFGDEYHHLNKRGALRFSKEMSQKYQEIFEPGGTS